LVSICGDVINLALDDRFTDTQFGRRLGDIPLDRDLELRCGIQSKDLSDLGRGGNNEIEESWIAG
jgi:hypothetical protein